MKWLAILDMDGTILEQRTVDVLCEQLGLSERLMEIDERLKPLQGHEVSERIAGLFAGIKTSTLSAIFDKMTLVEGVQDFVKFLKLRDFLTAIVTDSYEFLASKLAKKLGIDEVRGNKLESTNGVLTGRIAMPLGWEDEKQENCQKKAVCKLRVMKHLLKENQIQDDRSLAVGDSESDYCIIKNARLGVAFRPKHDSILKISNVVIRTDFYDLIDWLKRFLDSLCS